MVVGEGERGVGDGEAAVAPRGEVLVRGDGAGAGLKGVELGPRGPVHDVYRPVPRPAARHLALHRAQPLKEVRVCLPGGQGGQGGQAWACHVVTMVTVATTVKVVTKAMKVTMATMLVVNMGSSKTGLELTAPSPDEAFIMG